MSDPIDEPAFWKKRLDQAEEIHRAVFNTTIDRWKLLENRHKEILKRVILPHESILDVGCGYGRLLTLLPENWFGVYLGIDLSPDFIKLARHYHPLRSFEEGPVELVIPLIFEVLETPPTYDWAVMISFRGMIRNNIGGEKWEEIEKCVRRMAKRLLYLEYSMTDNGSVE